MQRRIRRRRIVRRRPESELRKERIYRKRNARKIKKGTSIYYRKNKREILRRAKQRRARGGK